MGRSALILLLALVGLLALACQEPPTDTAQPSAAESPSAEPSATTPLSQEQPKRGGVFRQLWLEPATLDPHVTQDAGSAAIVEEVFTGLVSLSTDLTIIPDIAERWEITNGGTTYTFSLRDDVRFHDGKPVTAYDFQYSLERAADPRTQSPVTATYLGDIVGVMEKLLGQTTAISGVQVLDNLTLVLTTDAPKAYFLAKLTYPTAFVVDRENIEEQGDHWTQKPNGTGPFKLKEHSIGEIIVLERNDLFYRRPAYLDRVEFILRGGSPMAMYENGEIDITGVGLADLARVEDPTEPLHQELVAAPPQFSLVYIGFNVTMPPFDDRNIRQALALAIDKALIASEVLVRAQTPAYGILPPGFPGYNPHIQGLSFDADRARQLLRESRYNLESGSFPTVLLTTPGTSGALSRDMEAIIEMWRQTLGIEVEAQQAEWATFLQDVNRQRLQLFAGLSWQADYADPQDFLDILFHSQSEINHWAYSNPQVDRLLEQASVEQDPQQRIQLYQEAELLIVSDAPIIPLWFTAGRKTLIKPYVRGYQLTPMTVPVLKDVWFDKG